MIIFSFRKCACIMFLYLLILQVGCLATSRNWYVASQSQTKSFVITRYKCLNLGTWDLAINGDMEDYHFLPFDYGFCYTDKSYQTKICCVNAYAQNEGEIINLYEMIKELLCAKNDGCPKLSAKCRSSISMQIFSGNNVIEYETKYAKGFITEHSSNQFFVYSFSKDSIDGFVLVLTNKANNDKCNQEELALKLAASIRFFQGKTLDFIDFNNIFDMVNSQDSTKDVEQIDIVLTRYYFQ